MALHLCGHGWIDMMALLLVQYLVLQYQVW